MSAIRIRAVEKKGRTISSALFQTCALVCLCVFLVEGFAPAAASPIDDDRFVDREFVYSSPGIHELATNLLAQLRQSSLQGTGPNVRGPNFSGCNFTPTKRNSELINSLLGLPKQVSNGRK